MIFVSISYLAELSFNFLEFALLLLIKLLASFFSFYKYWFFYFNIDSNLDIFYVSGPYACFYSSFSIYNSYIPICLYAFYNYFFNDSLVLSTVISL